MLEKQKLDKAVIVGESNDGGLGAEPPEANGGLGAPPPTLRRFLQYFSKITHF